MKSMCLGEEELQHGLCYKKCPEEFKGVGPVCWKGIKPKGRGVGKLRLECPTTKSDQDGGLCYKQCDNNYDGVGPACWQKICPVHAPNRCGVLCLADGVPCSDTIMQVAGQGISTIMAAIQGNVPGAIKGSLKLAESLAKYPKCHRVLEAENMVEGKEATIEKDRETETYDEMKQKQRNEETVSRDDKSRETRIDDNFKQDPAQDQGKHARKCNKYRRHKI